MQTGINPYENLSPAALDKCISRMARTLASKPKRKNARQYVQSIRGREVKTVAQIEQELRALAEKARPSPTTRVAKSVIEQAAFGDAVPLVRVARKQRISPFAAKCEQRHYAKHCRRASRYQRNISGQEPRVTRDMQDMRDLRFALYGAQEGVCGICGGKLDENPSKGSLDHVIPRSLVPREHGNYVLVHSECNGDKSNDIPTGCEMIFLLMVNCKLGYYPQVF